MPTRLNRWAATPSLVVGPIALASALAVGLLLTRSVPMAAAVLLGLCYAVLALVNLRAGVVLWVSLTFLEGLPVFNAAGKAAGLVIALAWIGLGRTTAERVSTVIARNRVAVAALGAYLVWITLSLVWASSPSAVLGDLWHWYIVALIFFVVATVGRDESTLRAIAHAFVIGAVISILAGVFFGSLSSTTVDLEAASSGRLYGAQGDPNLLSAGLVAAAVLAAGLVPGARSALVRGWLIGAVAALVIGIVASQSRGGFVAAGATMVIAFFVFRDRRAHLLLVILVVAGAAGAWLASSPSAWERLTHFEDGSGRTDIWRVAGRVFTDHPVAGVGLANFPVVSGEYVRRPGALKAVGLIVDRPHVAHSLYLETLASLGVIGLALLLTFIGGCLRAAWRSGRRLDRLLDPASATFARSAFVAAIAFLTASIFISTGVDKRLWVLLALGVALNGVALDRGRPLR